MAESGLPGTGPSDKGLSLDSDIPGTQTYTKPLDDVREPDRAEPGSIYRRDNADDLVKPQDSRENDERHHEDFKPELGGPGGRPPDDKAITKVPYRDNRPNRHMASEQAEFVVGLYQLGFTHEAMILPGIPTRIAARISDLLTDLSPKVVERGQTCSVTVRRVDAGNLRWIFAVNCGNGPKVVRVKARRVGRVVRLTRMDLDVSCSCPAFRWLGPEYHANGAYLDGKPRGTATPPDIRDPERHNKVCKHVAAVLNFIKDWEVPKTKSEKM